MKKKEKQQFLLPKNGTIDLDGVTLQQIQKAFSKYEIEEFEKVVHEKIDNNEAPTGAAAFERWLAEQFRSAGSTLTVNRRAWYFGQKVNNEESRGGVIDLDMVTPVEPGVIDRDLLPMPAAHAKAIERIRMRK